MKFTIDRMIRLPFRLAYFSKNQILPPKPPGQLKGYCLFGWLYNIGIRREFETLL